MRVLTQGGLYVQWYDSISSSIFLNYWWNESKLAASSQYAASLGLDSRTSVFAGIEAGAYQFNQPYDLEDNLGEDGAPRNAIATLGADFVHSDMENKTDDALQYDAFDRERLWWTGSSTGGEDDSDSWRGISAYITERSVITGSVSHTTFNTGHGLEYREGGQVSNSSEWSNINIQDVPVTWQWDISTADGQPTLDVDYDYGPDYTSAERFDYQGVGAYQSLTYREVSGGDDSWLRVAVTFADDPETVVELPIAESGRQGSGWTTGSVDLSGYAGRSITTLGLVVAAGESVSEGVYDEVYYLKNVTMERGTLELRAVGHDGSVSRAAVLRYDVRSAAQDVTATAGDDGTVTVDWSGVSGNRPVTVSLTSRYSDDVITRKVTTRSGSATFQDLPTDGGQYQVDVRVGTGTEVSVIGEFADTTVEPYSDSLVTVQGDTYTFGTPSTADWYRIYVEEDGVAKTFATTYNCGALPYIIRGRTTSGALSVTMGSATSTISVTVEDYSGNTATTVLREAGSVTVVSNWTGLPGSG